MAKGNSNHYWTVEVEQKAQQCILEKNTDKKIALYNEIRPAVHQMISSIILKKKYFSDHDDWACEFETDLYLSVFCGDTYDSTRSKVFSYMTRSIYNALAKKYKERSMPKNQKYTWEAGMVENGELWEPNYHAELEPEYDRHMLVIDEIEQGLWEIVGRKFNKRANNHEQLVQIGLTMLSLFRERPYKRVSYFKKHIAEQCPYATRNAIDRVATVLREEYQRLIREERFDNPKTYWVVDKQAR
jgi:hypothetical protein